MGDPFNRYADVKRGPLSEDELEEIGLRGAQGWRAGRIAGRLNRHPATVQWHLLRLGYCPIVRRSTSYERGGIIVTPFSEAEDLLLLDLRSRGLSGEKIAARLTDAFGHKRSGHTVLVRATMLASAAAFAEAAA